MHEYCKRFQQPKKECIFQAFCTRQYNSSVNKQRTRQLSCSLKRSQFHQSSNNNNNQNCMSITKWNMRLLQSGTAFRYYKVGQAFLQSETALFFTNQNDFITKWDRYYKVGQFYYKAGQVLQSGTVITKWALTLTNRFQMCKASVPKIYLLVLRHALCKIDTNYYLTRTFRINSFMPMCFQVKFGTKITIVIICFDLYIKGLTNLTGRSLPWSY